MDWKLEVVVLPVSDVDRAKHFYSDQLGFNVDVDYRAGDFRTVQLTPPGSTCSIALGPLRLEAGSRPLAALQLVVSDVEAARAQLLEQGVEVSPIQHFEEGVPVEGRAGDWNTFVFFSDPDGNNWSIQEKPATA